MIGLEFGMTIRECRDGRYGGRHFRKEIIVLCVRWHITYRLSDRDLMEIMAERGVSVAPSPVLRWVLSNVPEYVKRWDRYRRAVGCSWRAAETYILVKGQWCYLYRAVDKRGRSVDFYLSPRRDIGAAIQFFRKALASHHRKLPRKITVDGIPATRPAPRLLRRRNATYRRVIVRTCQYLNNILEHDHRAIKQRVSAMLGFKSSSRAATTLMGIELAHRIRKHQYSIRYRRTRGYGSLAGAWNLALAGNIPYSVDRLFLVPNEIAPEPLARTRREGPNAPRLSRVLRRRIATKGRK